MDWKLEQGGQSAEREAGNEPERRVACTAFVNIQAVHEVVRYLAGRCDGANALDGEGFNREDAWAGHSWARKVKLTVGEAEQARSMIRKYRRQIPEEMWRKLWR